MHRERVEQDRNLPGKTWPIPALWSGGHQKETFQTRDLAFQWMCRQLTEWKRQAERKVSSDAGPG